MDKIKREIIELKSRITLNNHKIEEGERDIKLLQERIERLKEYNKRFEEAIKDNESKLNSL